jgi:hypothetical protein
VSSLISSFSLLENGGIQRGVLSLSGWSLSRRGKQSDILHLPPFNLSTTAHQLRKEERERRMRLVTNTVSSLGTMPSPPSSPALVSPRAKASVEVTQFPLSSSNIPSIQSDRKLSRDWHLQSTPLPAIPVCVCERVRERETTRL